MRKGPIYRLPQELIDEVVDCVYSDLSDDNDGALLSHHVACPLVCRFFTQRSQMHVFHAIKVGTYREDRSEERARRIQRLKRILKRNRRLISYIIRLTIEIPQDNEWLGTDKTFLDVIKTIVNKDHSLQALSLWGSYGHLVNPSAVLNSFFAPFILPSITSLELRCIPAFPLSIIARCTQLKTLIVSNLTLSRSPVELSPPIPVIAQSTGLKHSLVKRLFRRKSTFPKPSTDSHNLGNPPQLQHLEYASSGAAVATMVEIRQIDPSISADLSRLQTLKLRMGDLDDVVHAQTIIDEASEFLRHISLLIHPLPGRINLRKMRKLEYLRIEHLVGNQITMEDPLSGILSVMQTTPTLHFLEVMLKGTVTDTQGPETFRTADWDGFGSEIERLASASGNLRVFICLNGDVSRDYLKNPVRQILDGVFEPLRRRARHIPTLNLTVIHQVHRFFSS
ncbi:unnamed protein product [Cyclocybe aegerita]|uniref:Uncharacterized protein n=1 Tax=Cyclocybe aegerita TaxID=1973307 RepID=A0A8S0VTX5_CYCAE|nr:unnamed protein product [Cyclocybe aegerita]